MPKQKSIGKSIRQTTDKLNFSRLKPVFKDAGVSAGLGVVEQLMVEASANKDGIRKSAARVAGAGAKLAARSAALSV